MPLSKSKLKELRELSHRKHREEQGRFLVEGVRLVCEAVNSDYRVLEAFHTKDLPEHPGGEALLETLRNKSCPIVEISNREMEALSETVTFQGIIAVVRRKQFSVDAILRRNGTQSILVGFDGVSDPGNVGSMLRTCDWFGVDGVLLGRNSVELYNPKVLRATMGGVFHLPVVEDVDLLATISHAKTLGYKVYVADQRGETHFDRVKYTTKSLIVFGNEAWGVSDQLKQIGDTLISIRRYGSVESLNVGVACGIVLSAVHRLYDE
jgi:TrmH family RNA methyltransferase